MSRSYASQLLLDIHPSALFSRIIWVSGALALLAILLTESSGLLNLLLCLLVCLVLFSATQQNRQHSLRYSVQQGWLIETRSARFQAQLLPSSVITPFFTLLRFKTQQGAYLNSLLLVDNVDREAFRRLRVLLKVEGLSAADEFPAP